MATNRDGDALRLVAGRGEWFTFYENLLRQDYLANLEPLKPGDCVADVGANIGAFTVIAGRLVGPSGRVFAFEPDPAIAERLRANVELNGLTNVVVHNCAVAGVTGEASFRRYAKSAWSSLSRAGQDRLPKGANDFTVPVMGARDMVRVCGGSVDLLKVDCEGSEYDLFDALDVESARGVKRVTMEVHMVPNRTPGTLARPLEALGFRVEPGYPFRATRE